MINPLSRSRPPPQSFEPIHCNWRDTTNRYICGQTQTICLFRSIYEQADVGPTNDFIASIKKKLGATSPFVRTRWAKIFLISVVEMNAYENKGREATEVGEHVRVDNLDSADEDVKAMGEGLQCFVRDTWTEAEAFRKWKKFYPVMNEVREHDTLNYTNERTNEWMNE